MIYKALYDKLKACSIDNNSDNDIVLRLNTQYTTLFECLNRTYFHSHKVCESKQKLHDICKHSKKCTFYTLRFGCSFAAVNTIKPQLL